MANLTSEALRLLFKSLDDDSSKAADKYFELRLKLAFCLSKRGCSESKLEDLVDEILDRIAVKMESGEEIEHIYFYARRVLDFVWLEHLRKNKEICFGDKAAEVAVYMDMPGESDLRIACLRSCLVTIAPNENDRKLVVGYYDNEGEKNKEKRKSLAKLFGLKLNALRVKVCRLRAKLEICINDCIKKHNLAVTK